MWMEIGKVTKRGKKMKRVLRRWRLGRFDDIKVTRAERSAVRPGITPVLHVIHTSFFVISFTKPRYFRYFKPCQASTWEANNANRRKYEARPGRKTYMCILDAPRVVYAKQ